MKTPAHKTKYIFLKYKGISLKFLFIYLFWLCWVFITAQVFFLVSGNGTYSLVVHRLLIVVTSFVAEHRL